MIDTVNVLCNSLRNALTNAVESTRAMTESIRKMERAMYKTNNEPKLKFECLAHLQHTDGHYKDYLIIKDLATDKIWSAWGKIGCSSLGKRQIEAGGVYELKRSKIRKGYVEIKDDSWREKSLRFLSILEKIGYSKAAVINYFEAVLTTPQRDYDDNSIQYLCRTEMSNLRKYLVLVEKDIKAEDLAYRVGQCKDKRGLPSVFSSSKLSRMLTDQEFMDDVFTILYNINNGVDGIHAFLRELSPVITKAAMLKETEVQFLRGMFNRRIYTLSQLSWIRVIFVKIIRNLSAESKVDNLITPFKSVGIGCIRFPGG